MDSVKGRAPREQGVRRGFWWVTAALTCLCHLPLLLILLGGTAIGAAITQNLPFVLLGLTVAFVYSLLQALKGRLKGT